MAKPSSLINGIMVLLHTLKRPKDHITPNFLLLKKFINFFNSSELTLTASSKAILQFECVDSNRIIKSKNVTLSPNHVQPKELRHDLKRWNELIYESVFGLGGHRDHLPACLAHILYCILAERQYNFAYFFVKRIESARATPKAHFPYGMFLTRLFRHVMEHYHNLDNGIYDVIERVMRPLALRQARRPRSDHGKARYSVSSTFAHHNRRSSSRQEYDDEDDGSSRANTTSPTTYINFLKPLNYQQYEIPSPFEQSDDLLFKRQTKLLNQSKEIHKEVRGGFKSFRKVLKNVTLSLNQVQPKELRHDLKRWNELIYESVFGLGGHRDHLPACLAYILYCILAERQYNFAYFFVKRIESARATPKAHLPYGMFLTRLFRHAMEHYHHLDNGIYDVIERVMRPLALRQARRPRSDHGKARYSVSSTSSHHNRRSSSHQEYDDEDDGASRANTTSPTTYLNFLKPLNYQQYEIPFPFEQSDDLLFKRQTKLLNQSKEIHKEVRGGFKSFRKAL
uniref:Ribosomal protein L7Ae/L30e/S12e/Gadd45 n=1 Tax=Tanacetum cinerariifolium TaxID=118510 RepID=A0A699HKM8_TANCI|nr:ribosomal protein L7Ae/L30e/S12e/Gadd45 [Tanacetum cinerariifolium]